jgi:hypothetical protein
MIASAAAPQKNAARERGVQFWIVCAYLEIERLNMRSIFSFVASTADWAA